MRFLLALTIFLQTAAPQPAPAFALPDFKGGTVRLSDYKGKVVLLNFWATWCSPCLAEIPELVKLQKAHQARGLQIIGIAWPDDNPRRVAATMRRLRINYPIARGSEQTIAAFGVADVLPVTIIIDRDGTVKDRIPGILQPDEFEQKVRPLLEQPAGTNPKVKTVRIHIDGFMKSKSGAI
jgi:peroxiredoxin